MLVVCDVSTSSRVEKNVDRSGRRGRGGGEEVEVEVEGAGSGGGGMLCSTVRKEDY